MNVFKNFVPNRVIKVREKDAPWITDEVKKILLEKAKIYKRYVKHGRTDVDRRDLLEIKRKSSALIIKAKESYFHSLGKKLNDPKIGTKKYWSILNKFLHKRKIPAVPPILNDGIFVANVSEKASLFNVCFANQCTLINTPSTLPAFQYITLLYFRNGQICTGEIIGSH